METSAEQLGTLSLGALKKRALALGVALHDVDSLDDAENPVEAARDLVRGAEAQAAAAAAAEQIVLSEEDLGKLTLRSLKERAKALGAGAGELDGLDDANDPKAAAVAKILALQPPPIPYGPTRQEVQAELETLTLRALKARAKDEGVDEDVIHSVDDATDPKAAAVAAIVAALAIPEAATPI